MFFLILFSKVIGFLTGTNTGRRERTWAQGKVGSREALIFRTAVAAGIWDKFLGVFIFYKWYILTVLNYLYMYKINLSYIINKN